VGPLLTWKRSIADPNKPQTFGLAEFEDLETVFACLKTMNNLKIYDNTILVKADQKTQAYLDEWVEEKSGEWFARNPNNQIDLADLKKKGQILPYERLLVP
jgi:hypothetical protein